MGKKKKVATKKKLTRILSIDGGGIRGILPGQILVALEQELTKLKGQQAFIADYFDLIAGTSTGGILTCAYLCPDRVDNNNPKPKFTAEEAVDIYLERGDEIFDVSFWKSIQSVNGLRDEKYDATELEEALDDFLGDLWLSDLLKPCLITSYDIKRRAARMFTSLDAKKKKSRNFRLKDVARSTSAAPTYFEPAKIKSQTNITYPLIDGGVFANNPTMCAYAEARSTKFSGGNSKPTGKDMFIFSLGTGSIKKSYPYKEAKDWGAPNWILPMIDILMTGNSDTVHYQMKLLFEATGFPNQYVRIEPELHGASPEMDDASSENLNLLREAGTFCAEKYEDKIAQVAKTLFENQ